ncbi:AAA family ATPase [Mucilaginibacter gotjawali]|uniref:Uncharacterized protein n=2 Tax=Mucilaginibacter gotjawali TaxID=1550579 RepID=A0A110B3N0_9SPHI|nr:AAA family ATPase [Mucilaginibacter gotjawali]MBB3058176.1 RecA-family ATPase [Mucilaginibacter gotjawali]BAU54868.1 hypothetical protein MgSA37_03047 [Mucilaginibacter gotjawali]
MLQNNQPQTGDNSLTEHFELISDELTADMVDPAELLILSSANNTMVNSSKLDVPKMLFDKFWFEGELCILFADSNLGKSILSTQIANSISKGVAISPFALEAAAQTVIYFDFELSAKQFECRYSNNYQDHYKFNDNLYRAELNYDAELPASFKTFDDYLIASLEFCITDINARILIIDNLTYLRSDTEQAKDAAPLMKQLKALKKKYDLSLLVLAHTPKRDLTQPITLNDLSGSKMLMNFCDSAFTIGESNMDKSLRYLKQIKQRNTDRVYDFSNVCLCRISKPHNFLKYDFVGYGNELDHIKKHGEALRNDDIDTAVNHRLQGLSLRDIGKEMGISFQKVDRLIKAAEKRG